MTAPSDREGERERVVGAVTEVSRPPLCPEIALRLITPRCALWHATELEARAAGLVDPFWAFCWAGGQAVARHVLDGPSLEGLRVLDFGAGGGVCAIAAARRGARVLAADIDPLATAATRMNAALNGVTVETTTDDVTGSAGPPWDVVLAGDVTYEGPLATRVVGWLASLAAEGTAVLLGDPDRGFVAPGRLAVVATYDAPTDNDAGEGFRVQTRVYRIPAVSPKGVRVDRRE